MLRGPSATGRSGRKMETVELLRLIARLRHNFSRNVDVMELCDEAERMKRSVGAPLATPDDEKLDKPTFDKKAYMREYMRKKRQAQP